MHLHRATVLGLILAACATSGLAQQRVEIDDLDADRLNARQVLVEFEYDGSACEEVGAAELGAITDGTLAIAMPIVETADVCTMQIVEHDIKEAVSADMSVTRIEVTLLAADGTPLATRSARVDPD